MCKYKLLIADDDVIIRRGLSKLIPWVEYGIDIVGVESDGEDALDILSKEHVDIVVTDIKMSFVGGLELLEVIGKEYPNVKVILITGYEDFQSARRAVTLQAFDYLMKPVDNEKLLKVVLRAIDEIETSNRIKINLNQNIKNKRNKLYLSILNGELTSQEIVEQKSLLDINLEQGLFCLISIIFDQSDKRIIGQKTSDSRSNDSQYESLEGILCEYIESLKKKNNSYQLILVEDLNNQFNIICITNADSIDEFQKDLHSYAENLLTHISERYASTATIAIGSVCTNIQSIKESYDTANEILTTRHICGGNRVIDESILEKKKNIINKVMIPREEILEYIKLGLPNDAITKINKFYDELEQKGYISLESSKMIATELAIIIFQGQEPNSKNSVSHLGVLNEIQKLNTLEELINKIRELARVVATERGLSQTKHSKTIEMALEYIKENYHEEDLSLSEVSGHCNVSTTYLSVLFKQETGKNFTDHLMDIRMKNAMKLLRDTNMLNYEISDAVGFSNPQYFAMCFKKYTKITPTEFKNQ